jgi:hypothetical protein
MPRTIPAKASEVANRPHRGATRAGLNFLFRASKHMRTVFIFIAITAYHAIIIRNVVNIIVDDNAKKRIETTAMASDKCLSRSTS